MPWALQQAGMGTAPALGEPPARRRAQRTLGLVSQGAELCQLCWLSSTLAETELRVGCSRAVPMEPRVQLGIQVCFSKNPVFLKLYHNHK